MYLITSVNMINIVLFSVFTLLEIRMSFIFFVKVSFVSKSEKNGEYYHQKSDYLLLRIDTFS